MAVLAGPRVAALFRDVTPPSAETLTTGCQWKIIRKIAGVYEEPRKDAPRIKTKEKDNKVGPYCTKWTNPEDGKTYIPVTTDSAIDRIGWIDASTLTPA
ncbi:hypothetical protein [Streptosporangium sp. NPDC006930]|uniref:hypothetical protein n=1 Tax=Streptosporangium sp. NPDC006930 TaxID=3154783 RepID=UPI0034333EA2